MMSGRPSGLLTRKGSDDVHNFTFTSSSGSKLHHAVFQNFVKTSCTINCWYCLQSAGNCSRRAGCLLELLSSASVSKSPIAQNSSACETNLFWISYIFTSRKALPRLVYNLRRHRKREWRSMYGSGGGYILVVQREHGVESKLFHMNLTERSWRTFSTPIFVVRQFSVVLKAPCLHYPDHHALPHNFRI